MTDPRADTLARIRRALGDRPSAGGDVPRNYRRIGQSGATGARDVVGLFCERASEYRVRVQQIDATDLDAAATAACRDRAVGRLAVPPNRPATPDGVELLVDEPPLSASDLDTIDGVLTGCALAIAETGTIVLDGGRRSGRRALTLVPDYHLCVVEAASIVAGVPDGVAGAAAAAAEGRPITLVSGPSATSDIELDRVEGVHGPRTLDVLVVHRG